MPLNCCICGNRIGFTSEEVPLSPIYPNLKICFNCSDKKDDLYRYKNNLYNDAAKYFQKYFFENKLKDEVISTINEWFEDSKGHIKKQKIEYEQNIEKEEKIENLLITNGYNFEGFKIKKYLGIVSGEVVLGTGFLSEISASVSDLFGGQDELFAEKMMVAKQAAMDMLRKNAVNIGGNAIIGVDFDYLTFKNNMIAVSANGTSVIIEKNSEPDC
ncbi:MAG: YbjQ family protein [Lachnospiraceae bacterium]|nr:YbjQ family protein [Lachnospiraceae bacterium]